MAGSRIVRLVTFGARWRTDSVGVNLRRRYEGFEYRTGPLTERIKSPDTFFADQRSSIFAEHRDRAPANHEAPFASHAVVEARRPPKQVARTLRPDYEVVFEPNRSLRIYKFAPKVHEMRVNANSVPERSSSNSRANQDSAADRFRGPVAKHRPHFILQSRSPPLDVVDRSVAIRRPVAVRPACRSSLYQFRSWR